RSCCNRCLSVLLGAIRSCRSFYVPLHPTGPAAPGVNAVYRPLSAVHLLWIGVTVWPLSAASGASLPEAAVSSSDTSHRSGRGIARHVRRLFTDHGRGRVRVA